MSGAQEAGGASPVWGEAGVAIRAAFRWFFVGEQGCSGSGGVSPVFGEVFWGWGGFF